MNQHPVLLRWIAVLPSKSGHCLFLSNRAFLQKKKKKNYADYLADIPNESSEEKFGSEVIQGNSH